MNGHENYVMDRLAITAVRLRNAITSAAAYDVSRETSYAYPGIGGIP